MDLPTPGGPTTSRLSPSAQATLRSRPQRAGTSPGPSRRNAAPSTTPPAAPAPPRPRPRFAGRRRGGRPDRVLSSAHRPAPPAGGPGRTRPPGGRTTGAWAAAGQAAAPLAAGPRFQSPPPSSAATVTASTGSPRPHTRRIASKMRRLAGSEKSSGLHLTGGFADGRTGEQHRPQQGRFRVRVPGRARPRRQPRHPTPPPWLERCTGRRPAFRSAREVVNPWLQRRCRNLNSRPRPGKENHRLPSGSAGRRAGPTIAAAGSGRPPSAPRCRHDRSRRYPV